QDLRRLAVGVFDRAEEGTDLPLVGSGVLQDAGDDAALVLGGDRGVLAGAERHVEPAGLDHRGEVQQPLGKVGRPDDGAIDGAASGGIEALAGTGPGQASSGLYHRCRPSTAGVLSEGPTSPRGSLVSVAEVVLDVVGGFLARLRLRAQVG